MKKHLHKQHWYYFLLVTGIFVILFLAVYKFKLAYTFDLYHNQKELSSVSEASVDSHERLAELKARTGDWKTIDIKSRTKEQLQQALLNYLTKLAGASGIEVTGLSKASAIAYENYEVITFSVELTGGYLEVIRTLSNFEKNDEGMRLASVKFQSEMNRQIKKKQLKTYLHVQHLQPI